MKKISSKIIFVIMTCSFIISLGLGSTSTFQSSKIIKKEIHDKLVFMSQSYANEFSHIFKSIEGRTETLSATTFAMFDMKNFKKDKNYIKNYQKTIEPIIDKVARTSDDIQAVYFTINPELTGEVYEIWYADKDGNGTLEKLDPDPDPDDPYIDWFYPDNKEMHWYYAPIQKGRGVWSEPYEETDINKEIISYTEPIVKDGVLIGVVGMDMDIATIKNTIENMKSYDTGYAFLLNEHYDLLIHPSFINGDNLKTIENGNLKSIVEEINQHHSGVVAYQLKGKDKLMSYARLSNGWMLVFTLSIGKIFEPIKNLTFIILVLMVLGIMLSIIIAIIFSNRFSNPLTCAVEQLKYMELGDFTKKIPEKLLNREDDLGTFIKSVNAMQHVIKDLMEKVKDESKPAKNSINFLVDITEQTQTATSQVATAIEQIVINTENEAQNKKFMEEALEKTNERLLEAQRLGHIGNWEWDIVNDKFWLSEEMCHIMGLKPKPLDFTLEMFLKSIHIEDQEIVQKTIADTLKGKGYSIEFRLIDFNGQEKWIYHRGDVIYDEENNPAGLFGISQDITEKKKALNELKKMNDNLKEMVKKEVQESRKKDAVMIYQARHARMGQMIGNIAHQWKQPLNSLNLILSNLKDAYIYDEFSKEYLDSSIYRSKKILNQMSQTIDDFRCFFKPRKAKEKFSIGNTIEFALELLEESIKRNHIEIKMQLLEDVMIYGYSNEFSQVLFNVLNNGKDALIERKIKNKEINIKVYSEKNRAVVEISNNGGCIDEKIMNKIFNPYFTTKSEEKGTGIGLYMSKMIIEEHMNGRICFQNIKEGICCKMIIPNNGVNKDG
ncbi:cache domain-containing protein [Crassaminicella profunda]|uniref:cache domain-containing protein n=1 Tax=Crassaminicella profunda TaxID=1286698 RepID=UPI001CA7377F|nr:cache domain-containing protein [Crassaminicella profunda]QZY56111.1 PAS domain-containing protein [Crassaminicella profunda]